MTGKMFCGTKEEFKMEIGSFLELELKNTGEYFDDSDNTARLNSGRSGIYHSLRMMNCSTIYLPYYLCPDVKIFLEKKSVVVKSYNISDQFVPLLEENEKGSAILIVNYFGLFSKVKLTDLKDRYNNVIIDNCGAFFMEPLPGCFNVYSCRKFFGVPDGCYVIGPDAGSEIYDYPQDHSSDTSAFLLMRIEKGCSASYQERMKNEERIDNSDVLKMSKLSNVLMRSLDYYSIRKKRKENFLLACTIYGSFNLIKPDNFTDDRTVPLFYPLVVKDEKLVDKLQEHGIYTGRRWISVCNEVRVDSFEAYLSRYMVPIPIDQRYGENELNNCAEIIKGGKVL